MLNRSKFAVFAAILLLLASLSARPVAHHVGISGRDQATVLQPSTLLLAISRPADVAKALPTKAKRDVAPAHSPDPVLPTAAQRIEQAQHSTKPELPVIASAPDTRGLAAWPRGPPAA